MLVIKKVFAKILYKRNMKKISKQYASTMNTYLNCEKRISEIENLIRTEGQ